MIEKIISFSIRNKLIIVFMSLGLLAWGLYNLQRLPIDAIPDVTNNQVVIATRSGNLSALEMEQLVTYPVETGMQNIVGLENVRSVSLFGISLVTLEFKDDMDIYFARSQVLERLQMIREDIPVSYGVPQMLPVTTGLGEIFQYTIKPVDPNDTTYSLMELRTIQDWIVRRRLLGTEGVAEISSFGGYLKQYQVKVDPVLLQGANTTLEEVYSALEKGNSNTGAAYIEKDHKNYFIRGIGAAKSKEDLEKIFIKVNESTPVKISDVAKVEEGGAIRYGAMTQGNKEAVGGIILMLRGANSRNVIQNVKTRLAAIQKTLPKGLKIDAFLDRELLIDRTIHTVSKNLLEGGIIVIFVLVLLLGHLRAGLIVASVIPLSMLFAVSMMVLFGVSGNLMSLGAIDFGLIVDGAVIVVENIVRLLNEQTRSNKDETVTRASSQMVQSSISGQLIIMIVYVPLLTLSGIEGKMFKPMALTVIFALVGALILSFTYVPVMSALLLKQEAPTKKTIADRIMGFLEKIYQPVINSALKHRPHVVITGVVLLALSILVFSFMGGEFIPQLDEGDYAIEVRMLPGTSLNQMTETATIINGLLKKKFPDEIKECTGKIGTSEVPMDPMSIEEMDMMITMKDKSEWKQCKTRQEFEKKLEESLNEVPGIFFSVQQPISMRFNELMTGAKTDVIVKILGPDLDQLADIANNIMREVSKVEGAKDVSVAKAEGLPQLFVTWDKDALARNKVSMEAANDALQINMAGKKAGMLIESDKRFDIIARMQIPEDAGPAEIGMIPVMNADGARIPLKELAQIELKKAPMAVFRALGERNINVNLNIRGRDVQSVVTDVMKSVSKNVKLPEGYRVTYGGQFENLQHAQSRLKIVVPVALVMIFLLLYITFNRIKESVIIFMAIPFAAIGGVMSLWIRGMPFSISAGVGFIALFGVAVLNGMVLIGYFRQLEIEGLHDVRQRILQGVMTRFRPVAMTATVASLGFLPMALASGAGAEVQKPLATVVIGGLITSTLLTLVILPVLYSIFLEKRKSKSPPDSSVGTIAVLVLMTLSGITLHAQTKLSEAEFIDRVKKNHPAALQSEKQIEQNRALKGTAFNPAPAEVYMVFPNQLEMGITQGIEFPGIYSLNSKIAVEKIGNSEVEQQIILRNLEKEARILYQQAQYFTAKEKLLARQDSLFNHYNKISQSAYRTGEISGLIQMNMEARFRETHQEWLSSSNQKMAALAQLAIESGEPGDVQIDEAMLKSSMPSPELRNIEQLPSVKWYDHQKKIAGLEVSLSREKALPGLFAGLRQFSSFNISNSNAIVGLNLNLWYGHFAARNKAMKLNTLIIQNEKDQRVMQLEKQYSQAFYRYQEEKNNLSYYEDFGLKQADAIVKASNLSLVSGNISPFEYLLSISQAFDTQKKYLESLYRFNESVIELNHLK